MSKIWPQALAILEQDLQGHQFSTWIRPLEAKEDAQTIRLIAPSTFLLDWVNKKLLKQIEQTVRLIEPKNPPTVQLEMADFANQNTASPNKNFNTVTTAPTTSSPPLSGLQTQFDPSALPPKPPKATRTKNQTRAQTGQQAGPEGFKHYLNPSFTFNSFVTGKANQLAAAAALQVAENPGGDYNPFFIYGSSGLGKTHLMQAIGNAIRQQKPGARVIYLHSERFVQDMVNALRHNKFDDFKRFYRSLDALLIDDIQLFANKDRSQEEFFHTFNALLEGNKQIILTSDRFPKEVDGLEDRLKSRFNWGLTIQVEPPEFEMRVAILMKKAAESNYILPDEVAFFIAKRLKGNVRDLEGALKRVGAYAQFTQQPLSIETAKSALKDILNVGQKLVNLENIQQTVADFYKIRVMDLHSKIRSRHISRPRQIAMTLSKELTRHSLPEIGESFGGRDHTTVLHAIRKVEELRANNTQVAEDYNKLVTLIT